LSNSFHFNLKIHRIALVAPNDILGRRNEIKDCLAAADMAKAVKRLIDFMREFQPNIEDEVILLSMDFHDLNREMRMELIPRDEARRTRRQIAYRILMTLNSTMQQLEAAA